MVFSEVVCDDDALRGRFILFFLDLFPFFDMTTFFCLNSLLTVLFFGSSLPLSLFNGLYNIHIFYSFDCFSTLYQRSLGSRRWLCRYTERSGMDWFPTLDQERTEKRDMIFTVVLRYSKSHAMLHYPNHCLHHTAHVYCTKICFRKTVEFELL